MSIRADVLCTTQRELKDGRWVIARPMPIDSWLARLQDAWLVFRGKAEAVTFEEQ